MSLSTVCGCRNVERIDLADEAGRIDQEHLEHVRELAARAAARPVDRPAHVLAEALDQRHQLPGRARGEEVPPDARAVVLHAAAGVAPHHRRRVARGIERQRDQLDLLAQGGPGADRFLQRVEHAVGERAALGIDAGGVDEPEQRDALAREARQPLRPAVDAQHLAVRRGHDPVQGVGARRRRLEVERGQRRRLVRQRRRGAGEQRQQRRQPPHDDCSDLEPSFMWWARPSFSLVKSTSKTCLSSLPSQVKPRRNCSLSAPPLSQLASSDDVM